MHYNNICIKVPKRPRPTTLSLTPKVTAAPLVLEELEPEPVLVAVPLPLAMPVGLATLPLHSLVPAMALLPVMAPQLEERSAVLSMLDPPETMVRPGRETLYPALVWSNELIDRTYEEKFPVKSMAPPIVESLLKEMPPRAELLAIWNAPPTDVRPGIVMFERVGLATMAKPPDLPPKLPTVVKFGALIDVK